MNPFYQRSFLRLLDFSSAEIQQLLALSLELKQAKNQAMNSSISQEKILH
ncbi:ornithine carbamoyltransferase subunit I [Proteus mirabilis]|nr:ornithine carbamoyltransferase subunit I [Proteus mirabilis]